MKPGVVALVAGLIFSLGLGLSGMTQPSKVVGFLDVFGAWDPTLMFVMAGAIFVHFFAYRFIRSRPKPVFAQEWRVPKRQDITLSLVGGSLIFGVGWGLAGYCPGPAIVSLASGQSRPFIFVAGLVLGLVVFQIATRISRAG